MSESESEYRGEILPVIKREVIQNDAIANLGRVAAMYGYNLHSNPQFELLTLKETKALLPHTTSQLVERLTATAHAMGQDPEDLPVNKPLLWTRNKRKHFSVEVFNTVSTLAERKTILETLKDETGLDELPEEFAHYVPKINFGVTRKRLKGEAAAAQAHFRVILPSIISVDRLL